MANGGPANEGNGRAARAPSLTLTQRTDLPPRVRQILNGLLEQACGYFERVIGATLDEVEHELFKLAERSGNNADQQTAFGDLREIRVGRADVAPRFLEQLESAIAAIRHAPARGAPAEADSTLQLVDASAFEQDLAVREIAARAEVRNSQALFALGHRFGAIAGTPVWSNESLPLGPARLMDAFRLALRHVALAPAHRVLVFRQFERTAMLPIGTYYESINGYLVAQRVLPHLAAHVSYRRAENAAARAPEPAPADAPEAPATAPAPAPAAREQPPRGSRPPASPPRPSLAGAPDPIDEELFQTLRDLLGERRRFEGGARSRGVSASPTELQSVLDGLQHGAKPTRYDSEHFRNTLQVKLRRATPDGSRPLDLAQEDEDTVDLVGMLFDYITRNVREGSAARTLLTQLHVPVLRVALGDRRFFTHRAHPARELLNTIAETGARWIDDADSDPELVRQMQRVVDHVGDEFNGDLGVFETLLADLGRHMQVLARRAEVVERRHVDAAKGRDKLDVARDIARRAVTLVLENSTPAGFVRALLEHAWTDSLALIALRHGENSQQFRDGIAVAQRLARRSPAADADDEDLRDELDQGLRQVGLHATDIAAVLDRVLGREKAPVQAPAESDRVAHVLSGRTRLGANAPKEKDAADELPPSPQEAAMLERLRHVAFGTWFDFALNGEGDFVRRKLAWFSTVTGRCLFVTQRGAHAEDRTLRQLARELLGGQVRFAEVEQASLIDRAWKAISEALRLRPAPAKGATA